MRLIYLLVIESLIATGSFFGGYGIKSPTPPKVIDEQKMAAAEAKRQRKAEKRLACK